MTASTQNLCGTFFPCSITHAIFWITRLFLSTMPFCGIFRAENSCLMPYSSQKLINLEFLNFLSWSVLVLRMHLIFVPFSTCTFKHKAQNIEKLSDFSQIKLNDVSLKKLSTATKIYFFPPILSIWVGPIKSIWTSSKGLEVAIYLTFLCIDLIYFPNWHGP